MGEGYQLFQKCLNDATVDKADEDRHYPTQRELDEHLEGEFHTPFSRWKRWTERRAAAGES